MNSLKLIGVAATGLLLTSVTVMADELIVIHRSGKIQTIQIDGNADPIDQVSFRRKAESPHVLQKESQPSPAPTVNTAPALPAAVSATPSAPVAAPKAAETPKSPAKPGVKIKWAEPLDAKY